MVKPNSQNARILRALSKGTGTGRCIIVGAGSVCLGTLPLVSTVTDDGGNTYTMEVQQTNVFEDCEAWSTITTNAVTQITVTFDSTCSDSPVFAAAGEYSGVGEVGVNGSNTGGSGPIQVDLTTTVANTVGVMFVCPGGACSVSNPSDNERKNLVDTGCASVAGAFQMQDATIASASTHSFTADTGGCGWPGVAVELRPSGANTETFTVSATITPTATLTRTATTSPTANPAPAVCDQAWFTAEVGAHGGPQVIDMRSNQIIAAPNDPIYAEDNLGLWFAPNGQFVVTASYLGSSLWKYSTMAPYVGQFISPAEGNRNGYVSPDSSRAYFTNALNAKIFSVDTASWTVVATISGAGIGGSGVTTNKAGTELWNTSHFSDEPYQDGVTVYSLPSFSVVATIPTDPQGFDGLVLGSPNGARMYVTTNGSNSVNAIDTATYAVVGTVSTYANPIGLAISPNGSRAYVNTCCGSPSINVIDTASFAIIATVDISYHPHGNFVTADNSYLWVCDYAMGVGPFKVRKYDAASLALGSLVQVAEITTTDVLDCWDANSAAILQSPLCPPTSSKIILPGKKRLRANPR